MARRLLLRFPLVAAIALAGWTFGSAAGRADLPSRLTDQEFWRLTEELSEPNGSFRSDNLLSNELVFARVVPELVTKTKPGGVYVGVGPEQNFTYMAVMRPKAAIIIDIRRGNLLLQLMYKALFELAADRADFVSLLFTKPRPPSLTTESSAQDLMNAYWDARTSEPPVYRRNLEAIFHVLVTRHGLPLSSEDLSGIEYVYHSFYWFGPSITWSSSAGGQSGGRATYADLMMQTDPAGRELSYLSSEEKFKILKDLQARNLVVPVVGNFGGPKAIRAVGAWLKQRSATVTAFYVSNVEQYLRQDGLSQAFCGNVAALPLDDESVFIRPNPSLGLFSLRRQPVTVTVDGRATMPRGGPVMVYGGPGSSAPVSSIAAEVKACAPGGRPAPAPR